MPASNFPEYTRGIEDALAASAAAGETDVALPLWQGSDSWAKDELSVPDIT